MSYTQLIISPRLNHNINKYVRYVNIVNVVLFAETSIVMYFGNIFAFLCDLVTLKR